MKQNLTRMDIPAKKRKETGSEPDRNLEYT